MRSYCASVDQACAMSRADPIRPTPLRDFATPLPTPAASWRADDAGQPRRRRGSARARNETELFALSQTSISLIHISTPLLAPPATLSWRESRPLARRLRP